MKKFAPIIIAVLLAGCSTTEEPADTDMPVIEAWIDSGGYPVVLLTSAISPDDRGGELADKMIRWGKVTISDGDDEIIMTGKSDKNYFPPYKYFTYDMTGQPGKTYTITADYKDMHAAASCHMPEPTRISSISCHPVEGNDSLRSTILRFISPADVPAYYYLTVDGSPALMGWTEVDRPGIEVSIPVYNTKSHSNIGENFVAQFKIGEHHDIALHRVSEEVYRFWRTYDDMLMFGDNVLFGSTLSLPGNVRGGLGIFSARATDSRHIRVE